MRFYWKWHSVLYDIWRQLWCEWGAERGRLILAPNWRQTICFGFGFCFFLLFSIWYGFLSYKSLFLSIQCRHRWEEMPDFNNSPAYNTRLASFGFRRVLYFLPAEFWLVSSNFTRTGRMQGCTRRVRNVSTVTIFGRHVFTKVESFISMQLFQSIEDFSALRFHWLWV